MCWEEEKVMWCSKFQHISLLSDIPHLYLLHDPHQRDRDRKRKREEEERKEGKEGEKKEKGEEKDII